jgi:hypothetical protein
METTIHWDLLIRFFLIVVFNLCASVIVFLKTPRIAEIGVIRLPLRNRLTVASFALLILIEIRVLHLIG